MKALLLALLLGLGLGAAQAKDSPALLQLHRYVELDSAAAVRKALLAGQDPNELGDRGQRALHWALMHESGKALQVLLEDPRTDVNAENAVGEKPLWLAAMRNRVDWVQALLARGAKFEPNPVPAGHRAWTTLHYAATAPGTEVLAWLLAQRCCDLNAGSNNGSTPLMLALGYGSLDAAVLLMKAGADTTLRNDLGLTAWEFARRSGRDELIERLGLPRPADAPPRREPALSDKY